MVNSLWTREEEEASWMHLQRPKETGVNALVDYNEKAIRMGGVAKREDKKAGQMGIAANEVAHKDRA